MSQIHLPPGMEDQTEAAMHEAVRDWEAIGTARARETDLSPALKEFHEEFTRRVLQGEQVECFHLDTPTPAIVFLATPQVILCRLCGLHAMSDLYADDGATCGVCRRFAPTTSRTLVFMVGAVSFVGRVCQRCLAGEGQ